jgi:glutathione S-transferase
MPTQASGSLTRPHPPRVLWGVGTPRSLRAHWALHELDLRYGTASVNPRQSQTDAAELWRRTQRRKIPVLQEGAITIGQSAAIVHYVSERYASKSNCLLPAAPVARARAMEWCYFIMTELDATSLYVIRRHRALRRIYGRAPNAVEAAQCYFLEQLQTVERHLASGSRYLLGERFAAPDILLSSCLLWACDEQFEMGANSVAYLARTTARPAYHKACAANAGSV